MSSHSLKVFWRRFDINAGDKIWQRTTVTNVDSYMNS